MQLNENKLCKYCDGWDKVKKLKKHISVAVPFEKWKKRKVVKMMKKL